MTQNVVITGASAGIGRATAQLFGQRGANVALLARGTAGLEGAARDVEAGGGKALAIATDVADYSAVAAAADEAEAAFGPIDTWVNVAFTSVFAPFSDITAEEFRRVTEVSYLGYVHGTMAALTKMRPRDRGTIVQVGSALSQRSIPLQSAYCGAKHAINGFTESVRCELLHERSKVRITLVQMPAVNTPQFSWVLSRLPGIPSRCRPSTSPKSPPEALPMPPTIPSANSIGSARAPWSRSSPRSSSRRCWTVISAAPATSPSRPTNASTGNSRKTFGSRSTKSPAATTARMAGSTKSHTHTARKSGSPTIPLRAAPGR